MTGMKKTVPRRITFHGTFLTVFLTAALLCAPAKADGIRMTLGYQSLWAGVGEIFETLRHTNILDLNGIEAEFKTFTYGGPLGEAAVAGHIDNALGADAPVLRVYARKPGFRVVCRAHDWRWAVLVRSDVAAESLADLRGKTYSAPFGTTVFPRSVRHMIAAGIADPFREMKIINQDIAEQTAALQAGAVDAVSSWDPTVERLVTTGLARILYQNREGEGLSWLALSGDFLEKYGEEGAVRFLKSWIMAAWWASNNIEQAQGWFSGTSRLPAELLEAARRSDRYLRSPVAEIGDLDFTITTDEVKDAQGVMDFLLERKLLANAVDVSAAVDMSYLARARREIAEGKHPALDAIRVVP